MQYTGKLIGYIRKVEGTPEGMIAVALGGFALVLIGRILAPSYPVGNAALGIPVIWIIRDLGIELDERKNTKKKDK